jgi:PAS domain S-box-containing protein
MKKTQDPPADAAELRRHAEDRLQTRERTPQSAIRNPQSAQRLVHELQVHQIELEMQNEELRQMSARAGTLTAQYFDLYEFAPTGYLTLDPEGVIRQVNLAGVQLLGVGRSQLVNRRLGLFVAEGDRRAFRDFLQRVFASEPKECCEVTLPQAAPHPLHVRIEGTRSANGQECLAVVVDLTERKRAEEALRASEEQFRGMFDMASIGIAQADPRTGQMLRVNLKMCEITGYSAGELLQMRVSDFTHAEDRQRDEDAFQRVVRGEARDYRIEKRYVRKNGSLAWVNVNMTVIRDAAGQPVRTMATIEDVTERKRAELRIAAFANLGQRLNAAKTTKEAGKIIVEVADELLGWDACLFHLYSAAENRVSHLLSMDLINGRRAECDPLYVQRPPTEFARRAIEQGGHLILRDPPAAMRPENVPFGDTSRPSASLLFVPIRHGTKVVGILSIQSYTPRAYDSESLEALQALADYAGGALERLRAEAALGESEATFRSVWERSIDGMRLTDKEGRITAVNDAFCQLVKLPREKLEGQVFSVAYKGHGPNDGIEVYQKRFATGDIVPRLSARAQLWNGAEADLEISTSFVELGQRGKQVLSIFRNVSERKREGLRVDVLANLGKRLSAARSPAEAARAIYASADKFWQWDSGVLDLQVPESSQLETALAYDRVDGQRREVPPPEPVGSPSAMSRRVMTQGAELILRKPDGPPATDTVRFGDGARLSASLMCVPVRVENWAVGVLSIQSYTPDAYTEEDLRMLQARNYSGLNGAR